MPGRLLLTGTIPGGGGARVVPDVGMNPGGCGKLCTPCNPAFMLFPMPVEGGGTVVSGARRSVCCAAPHGMHVQGRGPTVQGQTPRARPSLCRTEHSVSVRKLL